jgi:cysteine-rich repeat protein
MRTRSLATMAVATVLLLARSSQAQLPKLVFAIAATGQSICDTDPPNNCIMVDDEDLFTCKPTSSSLPITGCDWEPFFDGSANGLTAQTFAVDVLPNGAIVFRSGADRTLPDLSQIKARDLGVFFPDDVLLPYQGGGAYTSGTFKLYLDGDATQATSGASPYDAVAVLTNGTCEDTVTPAGVHTCPLVGSLAGSHTFDGTNFLDEDLLRCTPTANSSGGSITDCQYDMFWEGSAINNSMNGFNGNFFAAEILSFDPMTFSGDLVFRGPSDPDLPSSQPQRDLVLYSGTFGNGICTGGGGELCAGDGDCPVPETCNTGSCTISATPCASDGDCSGVGNSCARTRTPTGTYALYFDGDVAGLAGQTIMAFGIIPDGDGDDVPDGIDNCPNDSNPVEICANAMTACTSNAQCGLGDSCVQLDTDGDGVGDVCDQCAGRDDAVCFCGDAIRDLPSETCDLGSANNGQPGIPCSATCQVLGHCTTSGDPCEDASDCPVGEGCCGNNVVESPEQCDDGNGINGDTCDNQCALNANGIPVLGCEDVFGPHLIPAFVRKTKFTDSAQVAGTDFDKWRSRGDFNLATGADIDPDTEVVRFILNQGTSPAIYDVAPPIGSFIENPNRPSWQFLDREADAPGAAGWKKGKLSLSGNKVRFTLTGKDFPIPVDDSTPPVRIRQTLRVGNECATGVIECTPNMTGTSLKCSTVVFGE